MKYLLVIFVCFLSFGVNGQDLTPATKEFRKQQPEIYNAIKTRSVNEWEKDHAMILYEINKQVESFIKIGLVLQEHPGNEEIFIRAIQEWSEVVRPTQQNMSDPTIDWAMVLYELKQQIKAKNAY